MVNIIDSKYKVREIIVALLSRVDGYLIKVSFSFLSERDIK